MTRRGPSSDGTFYFQAWHVDKVVSGESWIHNKAMADFVEQNLSADSKRWLHVRACVPTKDRPGLLVPYSICVKQRAPKIGQNTEDGDRCLLHFRDKEYPSIARSYFLTRLRKTLDFFNAYAEGVDPESPLAKFEVVRSSTQLSQRIQAATRHVKRDSWGDVIHGLVDTGSVGSEFKATRFLSNRGQDPSANPHALPTAPLQTTLLSSNMSVNVSDTVSPVSESAAPDSPTTDASSIDATSECSSSDETCQSSVPEESSSSCSAEESSHPLVADESSQPSAAGESSQPAVSSSASSYDGTIVRTSSKAIAPRKKIACMMSADSQTAVVFLQNAGNWLQYMMASKRGGAGHQFGANFLDTPIILAAAVSPLQALQPDGMMRVFFMSQVKKRRDDSRDGEERRLARKGKKKATHEWVIGSAKVSTRALAMQMQKNLEYRKNAAGLSEASASSSSEGVVSVVGPNNRLIEMTPAQDIPGAIIVTADRVEELDEGSITQHEKDGFVHIETNATDRIVELDTTTERKEPKRLKKKKQRASPPSRGKDPWNKKNEAMLRKPVKTYPSPFSRKTWRDEEPQAPQLICGDVMSGSNFLHVEDIQVFSFSAISHEIMQGGPHHVSPPPSMDESDGLKVWSPPVVGLFSWMWDHLSVGGRPKSTVAAAAGTVTAAA